MRRSCYRVNYSVSSQESSRLLFFHVLAGQFWPTQTPTHSVISALLLRKAGIKSQTHCLYYRELGGRPYALGLNNFSL